MRSRQHDRLVWVPPSKREKPEAAPRSPGPLKVTQRVHVVKDDGTRICATCGERKFRESYIGKNGRVMLSCKPCRIEWIRTHKRRGSG